jgi:hypothetical protein
MYVMYRLSRYRKYREKTENGSLMVLTVKYQNVAFNQLALMLVFEKTIKKPIFMGFLKWIKATTVRRRAVFGPFHMPGILPFDPLESLPVSTCMIRLYLEYLLHIHNRQTMRMHKLSWLNSPHHMRPILVIYKCCEVTVFHEHFPALWMPSDDNNFHMLLSSNRESIAHADRYVNYQL